MYCKYCNVHVETDYDVCPLCKNKLEGKPLAQPVFPPRKQRKLRNAPTFSCVYTFIMLSIFSICAAINIVVDSQYAWSVMVLVALLYVYFLIKYSIMYKGTGGSKIFIQTLTLWLLGVAIQYIFKTSEWIWSYGLPIIVLLSYAIYIIFVSIFNKRSREYVRYMMYTTFLGMLPSILYCANVFDYSVLSTTSTVVSVVMLMGLLFFSRKIIYAEFQKKGHL